MSDLDKKLIHISVPLLFIHFIEEFYSGFITVDPVTVSISKYLDWPADTTYLIGQLALFIFLAIILFLILLRKNIGLGAIIIGIILLFEFSHIYPAIISKSYYPGLISGSLLFVLGICYWYKLLYIRHKEK